MSFKTFRAALLGAALSIAAPASVQATGIPVIDAANLAQAIEQIAALADQLQEMEEQTDRLQQSLDAIRGARGISQLLNGLVEKADRAFASVPLADIEGLFKSGGALSGEAGAIGDRIEELRSEFALKLGAELTPDDPDSLTAKRHDFEQGAALTALALAGESFDRAPDRIETVEELIAAIDATPDLKASVDLNSRIAAENALLLAQLIQLRSVQLRLDGAAGHIANAARDDGARRALSATRDDFQQLFK